MPIARRGDEIEDDPPRLPLAVRRRQRLARLPLQRRQIDPAGRRGEPDQIGVTILHPGLQRGEVVKPGGRVECPGGFGRRGQAEDKQRRSGDSTRKPLPDIEPVHGRSLEYANGPGKRNQSCRPGITE
jgi:hypothetical protein